MTPMTPAIEKAPPRGHRVFVVMPAFNVAKTLEQTYWAIPNALRMNILVGDNQSTDGTSDVAARLGIEVIRHDNNYGYGGNLKRLFRAAVARGGSFGRF